MIDDNENMGSTKLTSGTAEILLAGSFAAVACAAGVIATLAAGITGGIVAVLIASAVSAFLLPSLRLKICAAPQEPTPQTDIKAQTAAIPEDRLDTLTGLANANGLAAWFAEKAPGLAKDGKGIFVLLANLEGLADIERQKGKAIADAVVIEVASRVSTFTGSDGIAARTGGDEFVAVATVVPDHAREIAEEQAGNLAGTITRPVELQHQTIWIGGSVGAAVGTPVEGDATVARARAALAAAMKLGPGRYIVDTGTKV